MSGRMRKCVWVLLAVGFMCALAACSGGKKVLYNHLISDEDWGELADVLVEVPDEDLAGIRGYIDAYRNGVYAEQYLKAGWKSAKLKEQLYEATTVINCYTEREFQDINCRVTAYMLFHTFFRAETEGLVSKDIEREKEMLPEYLREE